MSERASSENGTPYWNKYTKIAVLLAALVLAGPLTYYGVGDYCLGDGCWQFRITGYAMYSVFWGVGLAVIAGLYRVVGRVRSSRGEKA